MGGDGRRHPLHRARAPCAPTGRSRPDRSRLQAELTFDNLKRTLEAAGGTLEDVTQVLVYLTDPAAFPGMNEVYRRFFSQPYPNRATVVVAGLMVPGALIEIVAYAHLKRS